MRGKHKILVTQQWVLLVTGAIVKIPLSPKRNVSSSLALESVPTLARTRARGAQRLLSPCRLLKARRTVKFIPALPFSQSETLPRPGFGLLTWKTGMREATGRAGKVLSPALGADDYNACGPHLMRPNSQLM